MENETERDLGNVVSDLEENRLARLMEKGIKNEGFRLRGDYSMRLLNNPQEYLMKCEKGKTIEEPFVSLHPNTSQLAYIAIWIEHHEKKDYILAVSEIGELEGKMKKLDTWAILDNNLFLPISLRKDSTLFGPYIYNDDSYRELAPFTYSFHQTEKIITPEDKPVVEAIGYIWDDGG